MLFVYSAHLGNTSPLLELSTGLILRIIITTMQSEEGDSNMILFRRTARMKLKIAVAVLVSALVFVFVLYYINTGRNPMVEIKGRVGSLLAKYSNNEREDGSHEYLTPMAETHSTPNPLSAAKQSLKTDSVDGMDVSGDENRLSSSEGNDAMKGKPSDHELGHIQLFNSKPDPRRKNALVASDIVDYREGILPNARKTFYREVRPKNQDNEKFTVFFLHGMGLTSTVWINIGTFQILAELGYRALAVDLPGHGNSDNENIPYSRDDILGYMTNLFTALDLHQPVLVAPSKSGEYAMPLLMAYPNILRGLVAVAPSSTSQYFLKDYEKLLVPMLILFGEKDPTMLSTSSLDSLWHVPNRKVYMIRNATHACYVDHPPTFHKLLLEFLGRLDKGVLHP